VTPSARALVVLTVALALAPLALPPFFLQLLTEIAIVGLFATAFNLLMGFGGMVSFGHAAYFALGAYAAALLVKRAGVPMLLALPAAPLAAAGGALLFGFFIVRLTHTYFAMLSLAFAQLLYFIAFHMAEVTGGDDGLRGIQVPPLRLPGLSLSLESSLAFYYFALVLVTLALLALKRILDSPFGAVLQAIRENSDRAVACGYDIRKIKLLSFVFSALFCGLAGGLDALRLAVVPVESLYWTTSGQVVIMTLLGGAGTFFGPFVGAATFLVLEDRLSVFTESWPLFIGLIFMAFVLFLPKGIWGTLLARLR
jgi:branched-chain amino acid transport system permease protein